MTSKLLTLLRPAAIGASVGTVITMVRIGFGDDPAAATQWIWIGALALVALALVFRAVEWLALDRNLEAALARVDAEADAFPDRTLEGNVEVLRTRRADKFETYEIGAQTVSSAAPLEFGVVNDAGKIEPIAPAPDLGPRLRALELEIQALRGTGPRIDGLRTAREAMDVAREALGVARDCHKITGHQAEAITELANALELTQTVLDRQAGQIRTLALLDGMDRAAAEAGIDG